MKKFTFLKSFTLSMLLLLAVSGWGQGSETFTNLPTASSTSYLSRTWTGDDGVTWTAEGARTDQTVNGKAICWGNSGTRNVISPSYMGGMGTLSFKYVRAFTGTSARSLEVYVNDVKIGATIAVSPTSDVVVQYEEEINVVGNVILEIRSTGAAQVKLDDIVWTGYTGGTPTVATPTFNPPAGNYFTTQNVEISTTTPDATIYYTVDGSDPDEFSTEYIDAISIGATTTIKARAYALGFDPSAIATAVYTFPVEVADIAAFRAGTNGVLYKITGEVVVLHRDSYRNRHFVRDASGSLTIWDEGGNITTGYNVGDGVSGFVGVKALKNSDGLVVLEAAADPGVTTNTGLDVTPVTLTIANITLDHTGNLVRIENVGFDGIGTFATNTNYPISDDSERATINFRTDFFSADYIGTEIPESTGVITGIAGGFGTSPQVTSRDINDLDFPEFITFYFRGPSWMDNNPHNPQIWGPYNGWATPPAMTFDVVPGWWSVTVEVTDAAATIEYQSRFAQGGSTKYQKAFENFAANPTFTTTTGEIWIDASENSSFTWQGNDFYLAIDKITETQPVPPAPPIDWANLQYPATGVITAGGIFDVYAQVYVDGITDGAGQGAGISAWIGYSTENTNPSTWSDWVPAVYNTDAGNNDEYMANIAPGLAPGAYYYASRFQLESGDYVYGGYNAGGGGFWDGVDIVSGVLNVIKPNVVISQVYGGGGNSGAFYRYDFIELFNRGTTPVDLTGWSVQYASSTGTTWQVTELASMVLQAGQYYLIQQAAGTNSSAADLPTPDVIGTISMAATNGKVALVIGTVAISGSCPLTDVIDFVGFGSANCFEGSGATPVLANNRAAIRTLEGCMDTDDNAADFTTVEPPTPRNTSSPFNLCPSIWLGDINNDWHNEGNWSLGTPDVGVDVYIPGGRVNYPTIASAVTVADLTLEDGATLLDNNNLTINGDFFMLRQIPSTGWHMVSAPVSSMVILGSDFVPAPSGDPATLPNNFDFYYFDESEDELPWINLRGDDNAVNASFETTFLTGKGYLVAYAIDYPDGPFAFEGTLNTGVVNIPLNYTGTKNAWTYVPGYNLIGNPYPSGIDWGTVIKTSLEDDYAYVYNNGIEDYEPQNNGTIAANQGFFVKVNSAGSLVLDNDVRVHGGTFTKENATPDLLELNLANAGYSSKTSILIQEGSEHARDRKDALKMFSFAPHMPQIYTYTSDQVRVAVNSIPEIQDNIVIPLSIKVPANGTMTLSIAELNGVFADQNIFLVDLLTNITHNLSQQPEYSFTGNTSDSPDRFLLKFEAVGIPEVPGSESLQAWVNGNILSIMNSGNSKALVEVYNIQGQEIMSHEIGKGLQSLPAKVAPGTYIVRMISAEETATRKVVIQ